ncbi:amidohydrolase family protein [Segetibacter koreensis]|uniref:amidohydrolase family protein n=1 Tax=Segetibacter koreensis TaxID=398037 RepID=UPI00035C9823|nr:amidohydrolase family protein [Segetibacter koreensis]
MNFHKLQADSIFTGTQILSANHVLITDEKGIIQEITDEKEAGDNIEKLNGILTPGFVNCHCHLELSHMKGLIPEKTGLIDFVFSVVTQRHFPTEEILESIAVAENEMLQNGIVAVGDISNNLLTMQQKKRQNLQYYNFVESSGWLPAIAYQRFERSKESYDVFSKDFSASIVPHAPYSVSNDLWHLIKPYYKNKVVSIHNQETIFEDELFLQNSGDFVRMYQMMKLDTSFYEPSGKSSLQTYFNQLKDAANIILVHNTFTKEPDVEFVKKARPGNAVSFCLCVNANQYIEQRLPPIDLLRKYECNIVLGTDSLASNWSLSILDEMKTIQKSFPQISIEELLGWATINGAKALQMNDKLGSFEKGKQPGVVLLEGTDVARYKSLLTANAKRLI